MIEVRSARDTDAAAWDEIAISSDDAWLTHSWDWNADVEERARGGARRSFVVLWGDRVVGIFPLHVHVERPGLLARRVLYSNHWVGGGLALANDVVGQRRADCFAAALRSVHEVARSERADKAVVFVPTLSRRNLRSEPEARRALDGGFTDRSTRALIVPLSGRTADDVWKGMEGRARTKARKAERAGVRIVERSGETAVESFYELHLETHRRTNANPSTRDFFAVVLTSPYFRSFFAEHDGRVIAATVVATYAGRALYFASASLDEGLQLGANNLLQWHALQRLLEADVEAYEVGLLPDPKRATAKLRSIAYFLRGFGGEEVPAYHGEYIYARWRESVFAMARRAFVWLGRIDPL